MSESLRNNPWTDVYLDRGPASSRIGESGPAPVPDVEGGPAHLDLRAAVAEAQEQAQALREAVCQAEAILENCRELLDSLRAILTYPSAYGWEKDSCHLSERPPAVAHPAVAPSAPVHPSTASGRKAS